MKAHQKFWLITSVIIFIVAGSTYFLMSEPKIDTKYDSVTRGNVREEIKISGKIKATENSDISFERSGKVSKTFVSVGDKVKVGQTLITLENTDLVAQVAQAEAVLNKQLAGNTPDYIAQLQSSLDKAQNDLSQIQGERSGVENSKLVRNAYEDIFIGLQSTQNTLDAGFIAADNILGVDNELANDAFESSLSILDSSKINIAKNKYEETKIIINNFNNSFNKLNITDNHLEIDKNIELAKNALSKEKDLLFSISEVLDNTPPVGNISQTSLDGMKNTILATRNNITTRYSALLSQAHAIDTARTTFASYETLVTKAQAALNDAKNPPRDVDTAGARATLALAKATLAKTILTSPIDGIITKQEAKLGTIIAPNIPIISVINDKQYQAEAYLAQSDFSKVSLGNPATITVDSLGNNTEFEAMVGKINPAGEILSDGNIAYKIVLYFKQTNSEINDGLTCNIKITVEDKKDVLTIPTQDIIQKNGKFFVIVKTATDDLRETEVQIGAKGVDGRCEIISGLIENQKITGFGNK